MAGAVGTKNVEISTSGGRAVLVEGLQRDRRRRNDLKITLPDGRVFLAHGRRPNEDGWEVYPEDESDCIIGANLAESLAFLLGYNAWNDKGPDWLDDFAAAVAEY